ncbi:CbiX/SirB N-terminal domain-containing protein, partial [Nocardia brasiliensis]|uniref:CbiX/SirB N-terminal domain-containing protein n=1 Tax=Nocardia brasiliensis TaxID=37326 RepID=UPI0024588C83
VCFAGTPGYLATATSNALPARVYALRTEELAAAICESKTTLLTAAGAGLLAARTGQLTEICFATTEPTVNQAISRLHARGAEEIMVAPWFLAPGLLTDRLVAAAPHVVHADVIGAHPALSEIGWERYDAALANTLTLSA